MSIVAWRNLSNQTLLFQHSIFSQKIVYDINSRARVLIVEAWSSLVEGDEQLDQPNSQTTMELCNACVEEFFGLNINTTAFCLGRSSLYLLLQKSSMVSHSAWSVVSMAEAIILFQNDSLQRPNWDMSVYGPVASLSWNPEKNVQERYQVCPRLTVTEVVPFGLSTGWNPVN